MKPHYSIVPPTRLLAARLLAARLLAVRLLAVLFLSLALSACGVSLAEDIKPPENYRPPAQSGQQPVGVRSTVFPLVAPDPGAGAAIYAEKCLPCHGESGLGDGPQADKLSNPAAPIGSAEMARASKPTNWFNIVTTGNLDRLMPGFAGSLSDRQRWDVVAYVYTLSTSPEEQARGKAIYEQDCAACHGISGRGDGPRAGEFSRPPANWTNQERLAALSADDMAAVVIGGLDGHPYTADNIDSNGAYAVAAYVRSLSFAGRSQQAADAAAAEAAAADPAGADAESETGAEPAGGDAAGQAPEKLIISGQVTNATPGGVVPTGLTAGLTAFEGMTPAFDVETEVADDGSYTFEDVDYNPDYVYFVRVLANGLTFNSGILHGSQITGSQADLPVEIYDTTSDRSSLYADRLHVFFDFSTPGTVQVVNLFILSNRSDKVLVPQEPDGAVIEYELPEGATNLQFQDGELGGRYLQTANGFGDRLPISPGAGQHQVLFAFDLPYSRKVDFELKSPVAVDAAIVMLPPSGVRLKADKLIDAGERTVQGMTFQMYQAGGTLAANEPIAMSLSGSAGESTGGGDDNAMTLLLVGVGVFGAALAGAGYWLYRQRAAQDALAPADGLAVEGEIFEPSESILETIVTLDDQHASGSLADDVYFERRAELKARLAEALAREDNGS